MRDCFAWRGLPILLVLALLLFGCTKMRREEVLQRDLDTLRGFIASKRLTAWEYDKLLYAPVERGDTLVMQEGDTVAFRYTAYAILGGRGLMVESNIIADARAGGLPLPVDSTAMVHHVVGKREFLPGFTAGLEHFAHLNGSGWLGVPSERALGRVGLGSVPPHTPFCYYIEVLGYIPVNSSN